MKYAVLTTLILLAICQIWAGPIVFGDVHSQIAGDFLKMVEDAAARDEIFTWMDTDIYSVIQITDQGPIDLAGGTQTMVSVSLGFSEDDDEPETLSFGTFYMYAPLQTRIIWLDESRKQQSLAEAMSLLDYTGEMLIQEFFEIYEAGHRESREALIQTELNNYASMVLQWYLTPRSQGGAGQNLSGMSKGDLAAFIGIDSVYGTSGYPDVNYSIVETSNNVITLGGSIIGYNDGPLYFAEVWLATRQVSITRNPIYPRE
jgi:hypothetical protein